MGYRCSKEEAVEQIKESAKYVEDKAEMLVGEFHRMSGLTITIRFSVDEIPTISVEKDYITAGYKKEVESCQQ